MNNLPPFIKIDGINIRMSGYDLPPPKGFSVKENFPNCCEHHIALTKNINEWFEIFPNCCDTHKKINSQYDINKKNYLDLPTKIITQIVYTESFIDAAIKLPDWAKLIKHYLEYNLNSFGHPNLGASKYAEYIEHYLQNLHFGEHDLKKLDILKYIDNKRVKKEGNDCKLDLNKLYEIFQQWVKAMPNLPYFNKIKDNFEGRLPLNLLAVHKEVNTFNDYTSFKILNQNALVELLVNLTNKHLSQIKTHELIDTFSLEEFKIRKAQTIKDSLRLKQESLLQTYTKQNMKFVNVVKKWLQNEKKFMNEYEECFKPKKNIYKTYSFDWLGDESELLVFYNFLIKKNLIAKKTNYSNFENIFILPPSHIKTTPIKWIASNRLLAYLFEHIATKTHYLMSTCSYASIIDNGNFFINKRGKKINKNDIASAKSQSLRSGNPNNHELIDNFIQSVKKP